MSRPLPHLAAMLLAAAAATPASAQVIEIADNGRATTYDKPTRFLGEQAASADFSEVTLEPTAVDRYEQAARSAGVDVQLLRAVAWTESRGRPGAVSPKGALGVMQLMPRTAYELGVDPLDPIANLHGGARYLAQQLQRFGSVPLALAAYNAGPNAVIRWGGIPPYAETQAYVGGIMARWQKVTVLPHPPKLTVAPLPRRVDPLLIEVPSL